MSQDSVKKYIRIIEQGASPTGKTKVWHVMNIHKDELCGVVRWHGAFRKYCFYPTSGFLFDWDCLRVVADFMEYVTKEHYQL